MMGYRPQFQHKTAQFLSFTVAANNATSGGRSGGSAVQNLPFLRGMGPAKGRRRTVSRMRQA
jgi:hypothetical protein